MKICYFADKNKNLVVVFSVTRFLLDSLNPKNVNQYFVSLKPFTYE